MADRTTSLSRQTPDHPTGKTGFPPQEIYPKRKAEKLPWENRLRRSLFPCSSRVRHPCDVEDAASRNPWEQDGIICLFIGASAAPELQETGGITPHVSSSGETALDMNVSGILPHGKHDIASIKRQRPQRLFVLVQKKNSGCMFVALAGILPGFLPELPAIQFTQGVKSLHQLDVNSHNAPFIP